MSNPIRRAYGSTDPIYFELWAPDGTALVTGVTLDAGDMQLSKDGAAFGNVTGSFAEEGNGTYSYTPAAADLQCQVATLTFIDAEAVCLDKALIIETYGHPSAQHPFDGVPSYELTGSGTPQAAGATTVTLPAGGLGDNDAYNAVLLNEAGVGTKLIFGTYDQSTKVFTFDPAPGVTFTTGATVYAFALPDAPTSSLPSVLIDGTLQTLDDLSDGGTGAIALDDLATSISATMTTAMTESYAADGAPFTPAQAFYAIWGILAELQKSGTTITVYKLDGSTTAMTLTVDSATSPTSIHRTG